jgi:hypothetical protein
MRARADCYLPSDSVETSQVVSLASGLSHTVEPLEARAVERVVRHWRHTRRSSKFRVPRVQLRHAVIRYTEAVVGSFICKSFGGGSRVRVPSPSFPCFASFHTPKDFSF